jgi:hypothetical protein
VNGGESGGGLDGSSPRILSRLGANHPQVISVGVE